MSKSVIILIIACMSICCLLPKVIDTTTVRGRLLAFSITVALALLALYASWPNNDYCM